MIGEVVERFPQYRRGVYDDLLVLRELAHVIEEYSRRNVAARGDDASPLDVAIVRNAEAAALQLVEE